MIFGEISRYREPLPRRKQKAAGHKKANAPFYPLPYPSKGTNEEKRENMHYGDKTKSDTCCS
jgi:hypothetical protein